MEFEPPRSLADELLAIVKTDQDMRALFLAGKADWDSVVDEANTTALKRIVALHGWPTIIDVGADASQAAWLIAQHTPDIEFMRECLRYMQALPEGAIDPANSAYIEDRIRILTGEPQLYGTQFHGDGDDMIPFPIDDPDGLEARRASVGLDTFAENVQRLHEYYDSSAGEN